MLCLAGAGSRRMTLPAGGPKGPKGEWMLKRSVSLIMLTLPGLESVTEGAQDGVRTAQTEASLTLLLGGDR